MICEHRLLLSWDWPFLATGTVKKRFAVAFAIGYNRSLQTEPLKDGGQDSFLQRHCNLAASFACISPLTRG